jgi:hypothetical protein
VPAIELFREPAWANKFRSYRVLIDGRELGRIREKEVALFEVSPGSHEVELKIDWKRSPVLRVESREGDKIRLQCGANGLLSLFQRADSYLWLKRADS